MPDPKPLLKGQQPSLFADLSQESILKYVKQAEDPESLAPPARDALYAEAHEAMRSFYGEKAEDPALPAMLASNQQEPDQVVLSREEVKATPFPEDGKGGRALRHKPKPSVPQPVPDDVQFMFAKLTEAQVLHLWALYKRLYVVQWLWVACYALVLLRYLPFWPATTLFGAVFAWMMIQNLYMLHDSVHVAPFPPEDWLKYITHSWADFLGVCWEDLVLEHSRHHASTPDILIHGEFGWDPAEWLYYMQDYSWWTAWLVPLWHFVGANDTGIVFMLHWYLQFPNDSAVEKCLRPRNGPDVAKINARRFRSAFYQLLHWGCVWLLGTYPMGRGLDEGWKLVLAVNFFSRLGWTIGWCFFANVNHSVTWNMWLAEGKDRDFPLIDAIFTVALGGAARVNEMKFHDLHHAFPNKVGAMSMRGRFNGAAAVHDAAMQLLEHGLFEVVSADVPNGMALKMQQSVLQAKNQATDKVAVKPGDTDRRRVKAQDPLINKLQRQRSYMYRIKQASVVRNPK